MVTEDRLMTRLRSMLQEQELRDADLRKALKDALRRYSKDAPLLKTQDYAGDGSTYDFSLPADFVTGFSTVVAVEYPQGQRVPVYLDIEDFVLYLDGSTWKLRMLKITPQTNKTLRVFYTALHDSATLPESDWDAFCYLAASISCSALASKYVKSWDSTLPGDIINYAQKAEGYMRMGRHFEELYKAHMRIAHKTPVSGTWGRWKAKLTSGRTLITH